MSTQDTETTGSELLPKRKKLTPNLQLLYDEVKEKCQLFDAQLSALLRIFPRNESTAQERTFRAVQDLIKTITTTGEVKRELAAFFRAAFSTISQTKLLPSLTLVSEVH